MSLARLPVTGFTGGDAFACALIPAEGVSCWGANTFGQLGDGTNVDRTIPVAVQGLGGEVTSVAAGTIHACALLQSGQVKCWGANGEGSIGDGTLHTLRYTATTVAGLPEGAIAIDAGGYTSCAVTRAGEVKCWGRTKLATSELVYTAAPVTVPGLERGAVGVSVGLLHACALLSDGAVKCWGSNDRGQLGDGTMTGRATPAPVLGWTSGVTAIATGYEQTCAIRGGAVECVGVVDFVNFQDVVATRPVPVAGTSDAVALIAGVFHTCALGSGGQLKCWGFNRYGQLGDGTTASRYTPAREVQGLDGRVIGAGSGDEFSCAATEDGRAACWGKDQHTRLGNGAIQTTVQDLLFPNFQGLWWKSPAGSESGWGMNVSHQGNTLFATWFTYAADGSGMWLVMPAGERTGERRFAGALYRTTGPQLGGSWRNTAVTATAVGNATLDFADAENGTFTYTVDGVTQSKAITRQVFAAQPTCVFGGTASGPGNAQDLWWAAPAGSESGWGLNVAHQGNTLFVTWFTYGEGGQGIWMVMPSAVQVTSVTYGGEVYQTRGPPFSAVSWNPASVQATRVGSATFNLVDAQTASFNFTVSNVTESKRITRQVFSHPKTTCR
jgi:alpha-tubulin suppressor-like RCC1 family protein